MMKACLNMTLAVEQDVKTLTLILTVYPDAFPYVIKIQFKFALEVEVFFQKIPNLQFGKVV